MKPELLSPAGSMESLKAAIAAGADAVYIGGKHFGARAFSKNFTLEEIEEAIRYAHLYDVKIYIAVNTLIYDDEVNDFIDYIRKIHKLGIDAVIMQDLGMIDLVRKTFPNLEIHISTQAHIDNLDAVKLLEKLNIKRTVLPRETRYEEIKNIKDNSNVDLEIFVAGALCISYSGNCLMSSLIGGRSGNRGMCAGTCRLPYNLVDAKGKSYNKDSYIISTKDLNTLENIGKLIDLGITSFKIEGRMKSPEYVYVITKLYRHAIDTYLETGKVDIDDTLLNNLRKVFNRTFTKGFIFDEDNNNFIGSERPNHQGVKIGNVIDYYKGYAKIKLTDDLSINDGIRILSSDDLGFIVTSMKKDKESIKKAFKGDTVTIRVGDKISIGSVVLKTKDSLLIDEIEKSVLENDRKLNIDMFFKASLDKVTLKARYKDYEVCLEGVKPTSAVKHSMTKEEVIERLSKLGNTPYKVNNIEVSLDDNLFINIKDLNELRREVVDKLTSERLKLKPVKEEKYQVELKDYPITKNINYKISDLSYMDKLKDYNDIYVDDIDLYNKIDKSYYILPRVNMSYKDMDRVVISEFGAINKYKNSYTTPYMNVTNSYTVAFLNSLCVERICLSIEMTYEKVRRLVECYHERYNKHPNLEVFIYGNIEAMISKYNILKNYNLDGEYYLESKFKNKYPIKIREDKMIIYYDNKRIDTDNYFDIGVNNIRIDIESIKDIEESKKIIEAYH